MNTDEETTLMEVLNPWAEDPGIGKALVVGVAVGVVASFLVVGGGFLAAGQDWTTALGMGAFVAFWGGLGFGVMVGGVVWATRIEKEAHQAQHEADAVEVERIPEAKAA